MERFVQYWTQGLARALAVLGCATLAMAVCSCGGSSGGVTPASTASFEPGACPTGVPPQLANASCGVLTVPENRSHPGGPQVSLEVAIVPALASSPAPDPIVFFDGGPGNNAIADSPLLIDTGLNSDRNLILMSARGTQFSEPSLGCPEVDQFYTALPGMVLDDPSTGQAFAAAGGACSSRLRAAGIDLPAFNSREAAADYEDLRRALHIPQWNVFGHSYGTYLALVYMREHPQGVRSVVLDGVVPPPVAVPGFTWESAKNSLDSIFAACAAQPACAARYPNNAATFDSLVNQLEATPVSTQVTLPNGGPTVNVVLDGGTLMNWLIAASHDAPNIPLNLDELAHNQPQAIALAWAAANIKSQSQYGKFGYGFTYSVFCSEWVPYETVADQIQQAVDAFPTFPASVQEQPPQFTFIRELCDAWNVPQAPASVRAVTKSSIPTLVMSGSFDAATGPQLGTYAAQTLSNSTVVVLNGVAHGTFVNPCGASVEISFWDNPAASDTSCVPSVQPRPFTIGPPLP